jgi:hypothetical protein
MTFSILRTLGCALAVLLSPHLATAQPGKKVPRIGYVGFTATFTVPVELAGQACR